MKLNIKKNCDLILKKLYHKYYIITLLDEMIELILI